MTPQVNDILNILKESKAILFADDTNLLFSDKDLKTLMGHFTKKRQFSVFDKPKIYYQMNDNKKALMNC